MHLANVWDVTETPSRDAVEGVYYTRQLLVLFNPLCLTLSVSQYLVRMRRLKLKTQ